MKIIFLDIDGVMNNLESLGLPRTKVMNSKHSYSAAHPRCVDALNRITKVTGGKIVVSSTWRGIGVSMLSAIFHAWGVTGKIIGRTPDLSREHGSIWGAPERGAEIQKWIDSHSDIESFVILDDGDDMGQLKHRLVQADYEQGLTEADADRAIAMLNAPPTDLLLDRMFQEVEGL